MLWWNLSKQQKIWMYLPGDKEITDFTHLVLVILSIEEEVEEEVEEVEEEESGFRKGKWKDLIEDSTEDMVEIIMQEHNNKLLQTDLN